MKNIEMSIIVPVYNVEEYLDRCMQSIISQYNADFEIVLVDDGSKDSSGIMCDEYATKYGFVKVIHQKNAGLSEARNTGIKNSNGKYLMFVDSDDYLEEGSISLLIYKAKITDCDVLVGKSWIVDDDGNKRDEEKYSISEGVYSSKEYAECLANNRYSASFCAQYHICKKEFITNKNLSFTKNILHEDELWTPKLLISAKTVCYTGIYFYYHYMREGSIMHSNNMVRRGESLVEITKQLIVFFDESGREDLAYYRDRMTAFYLQAVYLVPDYSKKDTLGRKMPLNNSYYLMTKLKSLLYFLSPWMFIKVHDLVMLFRRNR